MHQKDFKEICGLAVEVPAFEDFASIACRMESSSVSRLLVSIFDVASLKAPGAVVANDSNWATALECIGDSVDFDGSSNRAIEGRSTPKTRAP